MTDPNTLPTWEEIFENLDREIESYTNGPYEIDW